MRGIGPGVREAAAVLMAGILVAASWQWGYQAAARGYRRDLSQMALLTERISTINAMVQAAGGEAAWLARQQQRLAALKARFPKQAEVPQLLNTLVDGLKTGEMKLVNVTQGNLEPVQDGGTPLVVEGVPYHRLPVTVTGEGRYLAVLEALERMTSDTFPSIVGIRHVELRLKDAASSKLDATLQLFLYVSGTPLEPHRQARGPVHHAPVGATSRSPDREDRSCPTPPWRGGSLVFGMAPPSDA